MNPQNFVALFFIDKKTNQVAYLLKDKPSIPFLHKKLTGIGGRIENNETHLEAIIREVKEEINLDLSENILNYRGKVIDEYKNLVHIYTSNIDFKLPTNYIENEGWFVYKSKNYHKTHNKEFPKGNPEFLTILFDTNETINLDFSK